MTKEKEVLQGAPSARTAFLLLSDEKTDCHCHSDSYMGCGCRFVGGRTGTVIDVFAREPEANQALAAILEEKRLQRAALDDWHKRSQDENPIIYDPEIHKTLRGLRAIGERNKRQAKWEEAHPLPPLDLQFNFWVVAI